MSGHVVDRIGDLLAGRLDQDERSAVEEHMKDCRECASDVAWTRSLREQALRQGVRHLPALRVVELARTPGTATAAESEHLSACSDCGGELQWAEGVPATGESSEEETAEEGEEPHPSDPPDRRDGRGRVWIVAGLAAAAVLVIMLLPRLGEPDLSGLAVIEPLPVRVQRSVPKAGSLEAHRLMGLKAYGEGEYASAASHLNLALDLRPDDAESLLYLGSTLLLQGEPEQAVERLRGAAEAAGDPDLKGEAAWQLGNALLLDGRVDEAGVVLKDLADGEGRRTPDALGLLEKLRARR